MRVTTAVLCFILLVADISQGQTSQPQPAAAGFSIDNIDKATDPCVDFYQYACGNWMKKAEIPADRPGWASFNEVDERNLVTLRGILEKAAAASGPNRNPIDQKIGDYYGACMDEKSVESRGLDPLKPELDRIAAAKDKSALIDAVARIHLIGPNPLFNFYSAPDLHNADMVIANIDQGGLTLPDRNYYIKDDPKMVGLRKSLTEYVTGLFTLAGQSAQQAADSAQTVLRIETALAKASMDRTLRRDPKNRDHKMTRDEALALAPNFYLSRYFTDVDTPSFSDLNVANPDFFKQVNGVVDSESLDGLKIYVQWHMLNRAAPWLSRTYVDTNFKFRHALTGQAEIQPRWKKIGYPDVWRDYSKLTIQTGDLMGNFLRANEFESRRQIAKISKPLDRKEWGMTPPTVNAYYSGSYNEVVFPAGILQPPFFDKTVDDSVNFGSIGAVIGHELTHGFDDQGRKYDPKGNLRDWWTEQDGKEFEKRASCVTDEYSNFVAIDDLKLNGKLTLGENTADNGGARIALMALENMIADDKSGKAAEKIDGYTPEQRFFLGFGRVWCEKRQPEYSRMLVTVDPHSPGRFRANGVVQNMPEFQKAWGCKAGQPMVKENQCRVW